MEQIEFHRAVVFDSKCGLYRGAIYRNHPTPSGCERWLLSKTTLKGFFSPRNAAREINKVPLKGVPELPLDGIDDVSEQIPDIPTGTEITLITPHDKKERPYVVYYIGDNRKTDLLPNHLKHMINTNIVEPDSSSGYDPELSAIYDHYVMIKKPETVT